MKRLTSNPRVDTPLDVAGRLVLVVGAARSGLAAARLLRRLGARVMVVDAKPPDQLPAAAELVRLGARLLAPREDLDGVGDPDLAIVSPGVPPHAPVMRDLAARGVPVIGELELAWRLCPARVVAVTGTNGKGTTCRLCAEMLALGDVPVELAGNIGRPLADCLERLGPDHVVVVEVSSFQLTTAQTFAPHIAALLNIFPDHLDWHATGEDYAAAKRRIFARQRPDDLALVVMDDPGAAAAADTVRCRMAGVSLQAPAEVTFRCGRIAAQLPAGDFSVRVRELERWPTHLVLDALVAAAAALQCGASEEAVRRAIENYRHPPHLMRQVAVVDGVRFVDDSKATNVAAAVADLRGLACDGPVVVITGGKDKGIPLEPWAEAIAELAAATVVIGETGATLADLLEHRGVRRAASMDEAVSAAFSLARPGYTVALIPAASSFDMFSDYADRGEKFAAAVARLQARGGTGKTDG